MTSTIVPPVDLAPGMPSRVVTISATDVTEGGQSLEGQMVRFALSDTLDVSSGGDVIAKTQAEVVLDANGEGRIRLPVYNENVRTWCGQDWAILVTATWGSQKAIRVPAGTSSIALSALPAIRPLRGRELQWAITGASVTVTEGGSWGASLDLSGGILNLGLTVPPGGVAWNLGAMGGAGHAVQHADDAPTGIVTVWAGGHATNAGLPEPQPGFVHTVRYGSLAEQSYHTTVIGEPHVWARRLTSAGWTDWGRADGGAWKLGSLGPFGTFTSPDDLPDGTATVWTAAHAEGVGLPVSAHGFVQTVRFGTAGVQVYFAMDINEPSIWMRRLSSAGWSDWTQPGADEGAAAPTSGQSASGFKTVPLSLTLGQAQASAPQSRSYRIAQRWEAPITRWRLCVTNRCVRNAVPVGTGITVQGMWVGDHAGGGAFSGTPVRVAQGAQIPDDGSVWRSGWLTEPIGDGRETLFSYEYTSTTAPVLAVSGGWSGAHGTAADTAPTVTATKTAALDIWIEAETYAQTPVIAVLGDSLSSGAASTLPVHDSTLSIYARTVSALPVHYAVSSDTLADWVADPDEHKVTRWDHLARADVCLLAMGHNDLYGRDDTSEQLQATVATALPMIRRHIAPLVVGATISPRNAGSAEEHAQRHAYNAWLPSKVEDGTFRDLFDFDQIVTGGGDTLIPAYDGDGIHLTTAGYEAQAAGITRRITAPPVLYAG